MSAEDVTRKSSSRNSQMGIRLSQIVTEKAGEAEAYLYGHRSMQEYDKHSIEELVNSLVQEGVATPLTVYRTGEQIEIDGKKLETFSLVSGFRRYNGLLEAVRQNSDPDRIHPQMELQVIVMERGEDQNDKEFEKDILIRSVTENEQRKKLDPKERLKIVAEFDRQKIDDRRGASALGISASQYSRDKLVVELPWLAESVLNDEIGPSDAAKLAEAAIGKDKQGNQRDYRDLFFREWQNWIRQCEVMWDEEKELNEKLGKKVDGSERQLKKFLEPKITSRFAKLLEQGKSFDKEVDVPFAVNFDRNKRTLVVKGVNAALKDLTEQKVEEMMLEMHEGLKKLLLVKKQVAYDQLAKGMLSDEEFEAEMQKVRDRQTERSQHELGREPQQNEPTPPRTDDLASGVVAQWLDNQAEEVELDVSPDSAEDLGRGDED